MKIFTIATKSAGYFDLLKQSADQWGYDFRVLGWQKTCGAPEVAFMVRFLPRTSMQKLKYFMIPKAQPCA